MKNEAILCEEYELLANLIEKSSHNNDLKQDLYIAIARIPRSTRNILPDEIEEWHRFHSHPDKYKGAIGGHISKTECGTSIGTLTNYKCHSCGEDAFVEDEW